MKPDDPKTPGLLRDALRRGDPAAGEPGLRPDEVQRMRRAVLTAEPEQPRRAFLSPAWATAAGAAASLLLALGLWRLQGPAPVVSSAEPRRLPAVSAPVPPSSASAGEASAPTIPERVEVEETAPRLPASPDPSPIPPAPADESPALSPEIRAEAETDPFLIPDPVLDEEEGAEEARPRQVQFVMPGGTRVLWMLHSESNSTREAAPLRPKETTE